MVQVGNLGPITLFDANRIVAYQIASRQRTSVFVFRTLSVDDRMAASVPGVYPRVRLLIHALGAGAASQVTRLFAHIVKRGCDASSLPDVFYHRVSHAVSRRRPTQAPLRALLRAELGEAAPQPSFARRQTS